MPDKVMNPERGMRSVQYFIYFPENLGDSFLAKLVIWLQRYGVSICSGAISRTHWYSVGKQGTFCVSMRRYGLGNQFCHLNIESKHGKL